MKKHTVHSSRWIMMLFTVCLIGLMSLSAAAAAKTTVKSGLQKESGKYYYYVKGVKIRNKWKSIKEGKKTWRYYFGKTGAAYTASVPDENYTYNVKVYTIGKKKYGFDTEGHMVTGLQLVKKLNSAGKTKKQTLYYFTSKGIYKEVKTKKIRKLLKHGMKSSSFITDLKKLAGKATKIKRFKDSCNAPDGNNPEWRDVSIYYGGLEIVAVYHVTTGEYFVDYYWPCK